MSSTAGPFPHLAVPLLLVAATLAQQTPQTVERPFDGATLEGWEGDPALWSVRDGCIVGSTVGVPQRRNTFLIWQGEELADFALSFQVRLQGDNNSGMQYRANRVGTEGFVLHGYQCDVHGQKDFFGMLYHEGGRAILARRGERVVCDAETGRPTVTGRLAAPTDIDLGEWHEMRIVARGTRLTHEVDGAIAVEVDDPWSTAPRKGLLGLQLHAGAPMTVWFRNLELKRLPTEEVAAVAPAAPAGTGPAGRIWSDSPEREDSQVWFRRAFLLRVPVASARLRVSCDNWCEVFVNGERVGVAEDWMKPSTFDVGPFLQTGDNVLALHGKNLGGPAALVAWLEWRDPTGITGTVVTDGEWRVSEAEHRGWQQLRFDDARWVKATVFGEVRAGETVYGPDEVMEVVEAVFAPVPIPFPAPPVAAPAAAGGAPQWIWDAEAKRNEELWFRQTFDLDVAPPKASLGITCDNHCRVYVNGKEVVRSDDWGAPRTIDVQKHLRPGRNVVAVYAANDGSVAGLVARLVLRDAAGKATSLVTDPTWRVFGDEIDGWEQPDYDDQKWPAAIAHGVLGAPGLPWSGTLGADALDGEPEDDGPQKRVAAPDLRLPGGFAAERLLRVPRVHGSWVAMCADPVGRLYASDQRAGLYRVTPASHDDPEATSSIERVPVDLEGCQGLCWAFDSLYAVVSGRKSGLYRLRDTDGDDVLDEVKLLRALAGGGEHGPHAVVPASDGKHLLVLCGNHVKPPELARSRLPRNWAEDALLPRIDDPNGHARGIAAPGGYLCLVDPEGAEWELYCAGFRNAYDVAVGPMGELFTFDADMEWDMGLPWYRPTRILQLQSGADYGWRSGSTKWPADYPDSLPSLVDVGPASPTGVVMAPDSRAFGPFAGALLCADWTFGTVYARRGGKLEEFLVGMPLPVSDLVVQGDHLYVLTGGRGLQSELYRIAGRPRQGSLESPLAGQEVEVIDLGPASRRLMLEAFHGRRDPAALDAAWRYLGSADPVTRHTARIAVESQPVATWRARAAAEAGSPWAALTALLALSRQGTLDDLNDVLTGLGRLDFASLDQSQRIAFLRVHQLAFLRLGEPRWGLQAAMVALLEPLFPSGDPRVDTELCALLCFLRAPGILDRAMPLLAEMRPAQPPPWMDLASRNASYGGVIQAMLKAMPPTDQIAIANALRTVEHGWTLEQRKAFFRFVGAARRQKGGASYDGYLKAMLDQVWSHCTDAEKAALAEVADRAMVMPMPFRSTQPVGPGRRWQLDEAEALAKHGLKGRDFAAGRNLFHAVSCASCHRFTGEGGSLGPDLTSLGNKFTARDVLEAILEPSKVISDQYGGSVVVKKDGSSLFGRALPVHEGGVLVGYDVWPAVANPEAVRVPAGDVKAMEESKVSTMPPGQVDVLNREELLDLLAFLLSRGDAGGAMFAR